MVSNVEDLKKSVIGLTDPRFEITFFIVHDRTPRRFCLTQNFTRSHASWFTRPIFFLVVSSPGRKNGSIKRSGSWDECVVLETAE